MGKFNKKLLKRILGIVLAVALVGGIVYVIAMPDDVTVQTASKSSYKDTFKETGMVERLDQKYILSQVNGQVAEVLVKENDTVKEGDVIARISTENYDAQKVQAQSAINALKAQQKGVKQSAEYDKEDIAATIEGLKIQISQLYAEAQVNEMEGIGNNVSPGSYRDMVKGQATALESAVSIAKSDLDHANDEYNNGDGSKNAVYQAEVELKNQEAAYAEAKARLAAVNDAINRLYGQNLSTSQLNSLFYTEMQLSTESALEVYEAQVEALEKKLNNDYVSTAVAAYGAQITSANQDIVLIDEKIKNCEIKATGDGVITELPVDTTNVVSEGEELAVIKQEKGECSILCDIQTDQEYYLNEGDEVEVIFNFKGKDETVPGTISKINDYAEVTTSALGMVEYKTGVKIAVKLDDSIKDGYKASVKFTLHEAEDAISVPISALYKEDGQYYMLKVVNGKTQKAPVTVDYKGTEKALISEGLSEGELFVSNVNLNEISTDMRVNPVLEDEE